MKCFKVVQKVLEDSYGEIAGGEPERDRAIANALANLSSSYKNLLHQGGPDFTDPVARFAYVYSYVPAHAHWIHESLGVSEEASAVFDLPRIRIACIGGGPGSDLVGILKFLDERGRASPAIFCEIVDGCEQWKSTWADIGFTLDLPGSLNTDYVVHRVGDPDVWSHPTKFAKADLFTLNFFVSEIAHLGDPAWAYIKEVLEMAKAGAMLLFNDNNDSRFFGRFDELASQGGWEVLVSDSGDRKVYDPGEKLDDLGSFRRKFGRASRLTGNVAWRVLRKRPARLWALVALDRFIVEAYRKRMFSPGGQMGLFGTGVSSKDRVNLAGEPGLHYVPHFMPSGDADALFALLQSIPDWRQDLIQIYERSHPLPRLHRWFAESRQPYRWSGIDMHPEPFPDALREVLDLLEAMSGTRFNTALGNLYRDGRDGVSWHSDDEPDLGPDPVIASLSLGATRRFLLRKRNDHSVTTSFDLTHGSLLLMSGSTQRLWQHCVPKTRTRIGTRINLTFRAIRR